MHSPAVRGSDGPKPPPVVMLVEDDPHVRTLLERVLDSAGFTVQAFGSPKRALESAANMPRLDVLVTDLGLPEISGSELADGVRTLHPRVELLYMSGFATPDEFRSRFHTEEDRFLQKPFRPAEFIARVIRFSAREPLAATAGAAPQAG
jgi:CheY-like chemotaxis protein